MSPRRFFGKKHDIVYCHIKNPFASCNQNKTVNDMLIMGQKIIRHPDGSCAIVSRHAIFNGYVVFFVHFSPFVAAVQPQNQVLAGKNLSLYG